MYESQQQDPIAEGTTFGWIVHGGKEYADSTRMFVREPEKLYSLDALGVEDRSEDDQPDVCSDFQENIANGSDGRYDEVGVPWVTGAELFNTNEIPSRKRFQNVEQKLSRNEK